MSENFDLDTGKNIVDALKADNGNEELNTVEAEDNNFADVENVEENTLDENDNFLSAFEDDNTDANKFDASMKPSSDFENNMAEDVPTHAVVDKYANDLYNFEVPNNVAVLKKLIAKLPSGVTRQTGAQIIKQTMEALGISMRSVLQEAQQVQESLNSSARECQTSIMEYKKQIGVLEKQAQKFQSGLLGICYART